ncbi:MAG: hypothetical protein K6F00_03555 [Lachnospiraceae bacterium]|nr:hypothetical protein [Lachnospiraceae bacterium]
MIKLWKYIDEKNWTASNKYKIICLLSAVLFAAIGFAVWMLIRPWILSTIDWMLCFIGYPIFFSFIVNFIYGCNHTFHDGSSIN